MGNPAAPAAPSGQGRPAGPVVERVAVIGVHGVGSPPRFSTARAVADLLVRHAPNETRYTQFNESFIRLATAPVEAQKAKPPDRPSSLWRRIRTSLSESWRDRTRLSAPAQGPLYADVEFMRCQLSRYESRREPYETIELVGDGTDRSGLTTTVYVYEMYWADLSRVGSGLLRVFGALYQLLLHVAHIGRKTLDVPAEVARLSGGDERVARAWASYSNAHAWAVRFFTLFVPVATLLTLAFTALFVPAAVREGARLMVGLVIAGIAVLVGGAVGLFFTSGHKRAASLVVVAVFALLYLGWKLYGWASGPRAPIPGSLLGTALLTITIGGLGFVAYDRIVRAYDSGRPGALAFGRLALIAVAVLTVASLYTVRASGAAEWVRHAGLIGLQWSNVVLSVAWLALWVSVLIAGVHFFRVWYYTRDRAPRLRVRRAGWTARMTLALAVFTFIVTALVAYQVAVDLAWNQRQRANLLPSVRRGEELPVILGGAASRRFSSCDAVRRRAPKTAADSAIVRSDAGCAKVFFGALIAGGGTSGLPFALLGMVLPGLALWWFLVLIGLTSVRAPDRDWKHGQRLGNWMTDGFRWLRVSGTLLAVSVLAFLVVGTIVDLTRYDLTRLEGPGLRRLFGPGVTERLIGVFATVFGVSAVTLAALRLRLEALATRARPALSVVLDVDNYLRESPDEGTPRARMAERYASLLRHVAGRTDDAGKPFFKRIVLVSHSQGTVITADLLRFLNLAAVDSPRVVPERFRLLTMGSPLRQLYAANFPHLYGWVDATDDAQPPMQEDALAGKSPDPALLRVERWVNLYTTGDYIGRNLWRSTDWADVWTREEFGTYAFRDGRRERCLGAGTHTRYWDSEDVAEELEALIRK